MYYILTQSYVCDSILFYLGEEWSLSVYNISLCEYTILYLFIYCTIYEYLGSFQLGANTNSAAPGLLTLN